MPEQRVEPAADKPAGQQHAAPGTMRTVGCSRNRRSHLRNWEKERAAHRGLLSGVPDLVEDQDQGDQAAQDLAGTVRHEARDVRQVRRLPAPALICRLLHWAPRFSVGR